MTLFDQLMTDITVTFKKRTMYTLVHQTRILKALNVDDLGDGIEATYAGNFAVFVSRTDSISCKKGACDDAMAWATFWQDNQGRVDYDAFFEDYLQALPGEVNQAWVEFVNQEEEAELGRIERELGSPENLPDEVLADPDIQKKDGTLEKSGAPAS
jgi:hypothetical protein